MYQLNKQMEKNSQAIAEAASVLNSFKPTGYLFIVYHKLFK